ncbi:MAG: hypothetical protein V8R40_10910 [Dysosmobacter sp.]
MTKSTVYIMVAAAPMAPPTQTQWMPPTSISTAPAPKISMCAGEVGLQAHQTRYTLPE